jgi:hypothetical protein
MMEQPKFLLRKVTGDQAVGSETDLREWFQKGQCKPADLLFDFSASRWFRAGDHPSLAGTFSTKPSQIPERKLIYYMAPGAGGIAQGPFSTKEIQSRVQAKEICESTWIFVEGDKEWRQLRNVKILFEMLPALPADVPSAPAEPPSAAMEMNVVQDPDPLSLTKALDGLELRAEKGDQSSPSILLDTEPSVEREDATKAFSTLGLSLDPMSPLPVAPPPMAPPPISVPPLAPPSGSPPPFEMRETPPPAPPAAPKQPAVAQADLPPDARKQSSEHDTDSFDGLTAEIPADPIWMVKRGTAEVVAGPFKFLDVVKFLQEGKLNKNDKISRVGTNRFVKIQHQYEFNVKFTIEVVVENGVEKQKILIKRRHPRVSYITDVQVATKNGSLACRCVNISAGGILAENVKADFALGDILDIKVLPGLINRPIVCKALIIGKIPKTPPAYALKFESLKPEDKEAIEYFVSESLKREMSKN